VLDEPTSALDVSVQAQILNLIKELKAELKAGVLLITHNISVAYYMSDYIYVMYAGKVVEYGDAKKVIKLPKHPYTISLMSAIPEINVKKTRIILKGETPNLIFPPRGCRFHPRCPMAFEICGWSASEVKEDLEFLLQEKYFVGEETKVEVDDEVTLKVIGVSAERLQSIINSEKDSSASLKSIKEISPNANHVLVKLYKGVEPPLKRYEDREISCLLFA